MSQIPDITFIVPVDDDPKKQFQAWESRRIELVKTLGHYLIMLTESELSLCYENWEKKTQTLENSDKPQHLLCLLHISVLHFFTRSLDQLRTHQSYLIKMLGHKNKSFVMCAAKCFYWFAEESQECIELMRSVLSNQGSKWILNQATRYSALYLLYEAGKFILPNVLDETANNFQILWNALICDDLELQRITAKVIKLHLIGLKANVHQDDIFKDCLEHIKMPDGNSIGIIKVIGYVLLTYENYEQAVTTIDLVDAFPYTKNEALSFAWFKMLLKVMKNNVLTVVFTPDSAGRLLTALFNACKKFVSTRLFDLVLQFFDTLIPAKFDRMLNDCVKFLSYGILDTKSKKISCTCFDALSILLDKFTLKLPASLFLNSEPCPQYVVALSKASTLFNDCKGLLMSKFNEGLLQRATISQQTLSLTIFSKFHALLFENNNKVFFRLRNLSQTNDIGVRTMMTDILKDFSNPEAFDDLLFIALFDPSKKVRAAAVHNLQFLAQLDQSEMLPQILTDPSYKVVRTAIPIIAKVAPSNPMLFYAPIASFVQQTMMSMLTTSSPSICQEISTLFPLIAQYLLKFCPTFIPQITKVCYKFLSQENPKKSKILDVIQRDVSSEADSIKVNKHPFDSSCTNLNNLYDIENKSFIDSRDANLFDTLKCLASHLVTFLDEIIPVYVFVFTQQRSEQVYVAALESLIEIVYRIEEASDIPSKNPEIIGILIKLLRSNTSEKVSSLILKLMATLGITAYPRELNDTDESINDEGHGFKNPSFFTDSVMSALTKLLPENQTCIYEAVTSIFVKEYSDAVKFLTPVIDAYAEAIKQANIKQTHLFEQLEIISFYCGTKMIPYAKKLSSIILEHIQIPSALKLGSVLSYFLKTEFIPYVPPLFMKCLEIIKNTNQPISKAMLDFVTYCVLFQNQPIEFFVSACEKRVFSSSQYQYHQSDQQSSSQSQQLAQEQSINLGQQMKATQMSVEELNDFIIALTTVVQLGDASLQATRIARFCELLIQTSSRIYVMQLLYSLVVFSGLSFEMLKFIVSDDISFPALHDYLSGASASTDSFLSRITINISVDTPPYVPLSLKCNYKFFDAFGETTINPEKWFEDLSRSVMVNSPHLAIRACAEPAKQSKELQREIFPVAFLSCWKQTQDNYKKKFSEVMTRILKVDKNKPKPDPIFLKLADLLIRAKCPFMIPCNILASACTSPIQGLRFLARYLWENPQDVQAINLILKLNRKLGRINSSRGILKSIDLPDVSRNWSEKLGEWGKALEIYEREDKNSPKKNANSNLPSKLRCFARLEKWDNIRRQSEKFQELSLEQKKETALWFAWASLKNKDFNSVSSFMVYLPDEENRSKNYLDILLFRLLYFTQSEQYEKAKLALSEIMKKLVKDCSIFSSLNANKADKNLMYANHFIEIGEAIDVLQKKQKKGEFHVPDIWERRLQYITGDSNAWVRVVDIRNLVFDPIASKKTYLKLLSVLSKERKWALVDGFQPIIMNTIDDPNVQIAYTKILWLRGKSNEAMETIRFLNILHNEKNEEKFIKMMNSISPKVYKKVSRRISAFIEKDPLPSELYKYIMSEENNKPTNHNRAKMLRMEASWRSSNINIDNIESILKLYEDSAHYEPNNYKTWAEWAYASMKVIDKTKSSKEESNRDRYIQIAIDGFLKASILEKSNTLEYMCQLFSLFFRYASTAKIPQNLYAKITELDPIMIEKILPQIVCQIAHPDEKVKNVVHTLIKNLSINHFQAIVFQLQLIANTVRSGEEERSKIAKDLLNCISEPHKELAAEANLFAKGLTSLSSTILDSIIQKCDEAYHALLIGEQERSNELLKEMCALTPATDFDKELIKMFTSNLCSINELIKSKNDPWNIVVKTTSKIRDRIKKIDSVQLESVSQELAEKTNFLLCIPGTYSSEEKDPSKMPTIVSIEPSCSVLTTQQHPRVLYMNGSEGKKWKFLLKGNEDLRLDQRIMQFFELINSLLLSDKATQKMKTTIIKYAITPLSETCGLISWVNGADTMHKLIMDNRKMQHQEAPNENIIQNNFTNGCSPNLSAIQKLEVWGLVAPQCPATDLRDIFWMKSSNSVSWLNMQDTFVSSTALMSLAGYVIGLGDRHPNNIMIQRRRGHVVHIDFGDSFEVTQNRTKMPEKVPFRLTRMIVNAFGISGTEGMFRNTFENILYVLRKNKSSIFAQLEIFVHEPIFASRTEQGDGNSIMNRVSMKLNGFDPEIDPGTKITHELSVEEQSDYLISIASDYRRYATHYEGWCPYW